MRLMEYNFLSMTRILSTKMLWILLAYFTCCIWAWPAAPIPAVRRSQGNNYNRLIPHSNLAYENLIPSDYEVPQLQQESYAPAWEKAQDPISYYDDVLMDDYWLNQPSALSGLEALSSIADSYDTPVWGQIVNQKPETELEELKAEEREREAEAKQRHADELQRQAMQNEYNYYNNFGRQEKRAQAMSTAHPSTVTAAPIASKATESPSTKAPVVPEATAPPTKVKFHMQPGQKEIPLLRPPNKPKTNLLPADLQEPEEPVITVAARSTADEKPSAYDTLRKYISLEDALKKEAEKRRAPHSPGSRIQKRTSGKIISSNGSINGKKQIISDVDSLTGQLHNLKKNMI